MTKILCDICGKEIIASVSIVVFCTVVLLAMAIITLQSKQREKDLCAEHYKKLCELMEELKND